MVRKEGFPTQTGAFTARISAEALAAASSLTLRGTLVVGYPRDVERTEMALADIKPPHTVRFGESAFTIEQGCFTGIDWMFRFGYGGRDDLTLLTLLEDRNGRWIADSIHLVMGPGTAGGGGVADQRLPWGKTPTRHVFCRILKEDRIRAPFSFSGIPIPKPPPPEKDCPPRPRPGSRFPVPRFW